MLLAQPVSSLLKVLADPTRLRILGLLAREELRVGELSKALEMSQSRVSNHLKLLREANLLEERHAGASNFLRLIPVDPALGASSLEAELWRTLAPQVAAMPEHASDLGRLERVIEEREKQTTEFFDRVARDWDTIGLDFASGQARQRAAALLLRPGLVLADLGCGTGYMARALLGLADRLICVDRSKAMLTQARERLTRGSSRTEIDLREGDLDALPIADGELDGLIAGMVLHHVPRLAGPLAEMQRVLKPGGSAVVLELAPHREAWMHEALGDRHLGLDREDVRQAFERAGFVDVLVEPVDDHYQPAVATHAAPASDGDTGDPRARLTLYLVRGRKPLAS